MKNIKTLILPLLLTAALTGCGGGKKTSKYTWHSGDKVYYDKLVFDTSDPTAPNPNIYLKPCGAGGTARGKRIGAEIFKKEKSFYQPPGLYP